MVKRYFRSPLIYESYKFIRSFKVRKEPVIPNLLVATVLKTLYIYFLMVIDLILFSGSGNLDIFQNSGFICAEIALLAGALLLFCALIMWIFSFSSKAHNLICGLFTFCFIVVIFNQFSQFDHTNFIGYYFANSWGIFVPKFFFANSHVFVALVCSALVLWMLFKCRLRFFAFYVFMFLFILTGILYHEYLSKKNNHDFIDTFRSGITQSADSNQKFIYLMLPNLVSYKYFGIFEDKNDVQDLISGFLAKNHFYVYPNAYNQTGDAFLNIVGAVNPFDDKMDRHIMDTMLLYKYWKFFNLNDELVLLRDNQMFDTFKQANYQITAYKSRGVDICKKKYGFNVDRCVEKLNRPVNLYSMNLPLFDRTKLLLVEWLTSMKMFKNLSVPYHAMRLFTKPEQLPMIGINYNNLYVVNSIKTFDVLAKSITENTGRHAYFVYADIPSDMFIYDQFCNIKPQSEWISLKNLPWVEVDNSYKKRKAYIEQTKCLYGKLQEFLDTLKQKGILNNTVLVLNGMSGTNNFQSMKIEDYDADVLFNRLIMLAIKSPDMNKITINPKMCSSENILSHYLYKIPLCDKFNDTTIHHRIQDKLLKKLDQLQISEAQAEANIKKFDKWYGMWYPMNQRKSDKIKIIKKDQKIDHKEVIDPDLPRLLNDTLQYQEGYTDDEISSAENQ